MNPSVLTATLLLVGSALSACGTRAAAPDAAVVGQPSVSSVPSPVEAFGPDVSGPQVRVTAPEPVRRSGTSETSGAAVAQRPAPGRIRQDRAVAPGTPAAPGVPLPTVHPRPPSSATGGQKSTVRIASVGTLSGPVGSVLGGVVRGLQVWVRHINEAGGVNGHLVDLRVADDGGDPARHRAVVQEMIEREGVVAFVANPEAQSGAGTVDYITSKGVPVVGGDTAFEWMYESPMYFPQATSGHSLLYGVLAVTADEARAQGKRRFGSITCVEGQICADADRIWAAYANHVGLEPVFRARASLAQPDFTAECLQARQSGVEVWQLVLDPNSVQRLAAACGRQGYRPLYAFANSIVDNRLRTDPNLAGALGDLNVFPFFQTNTPTSAEFTAAMRRYAPRLEYGAGEATGWVAAKLFERAAQGIPEPPSTQAILTGLWSLRDETLGGLTQPLTFHEGQPAPRDLACMFKVAIRERAWISLDGFRLHCSPVPTDFD